MTRVWVVARAAVTRAGLEALVRGRASLLIAGSAANPDEIEPAPGDVVLVEAEPDDRETLFRLASAPEGPAVVALTEGAAEALRAGVRAVLPREAGEAAILAAIEAAAAGLAAVPAGSVELLLRTRPAEPREPSQPLTPREIEVLRRLAEGLGNKTIAFQLSISEHTVKFHISSIFAKLGASSRTEAVTLGVRQGLILL